MKNKPTVSVGIPAYNEEGNISGLIRSILRQEQNNYILEKIFVQCDGCTDHTVEIVNKLAKKHSSIVACVTPVRKGKAEALNNIYARHSSDYLFTIDADLMLKGSKEIDRLVKVIESDKRINLVGPRHIPVWPDTLWGKFAYVSYRSFEDAFLQWKNGNNFYAVMSANLIRGTLTKRFFFPEKTISDQCYLYAMATKGNSKGFQFVQNAHVLFRPVSTFLDWRLLGVRSVSGDKNDLAKHFGNQILRDIAIPKHQAYMQQFKWLIKSPFYTIGSICMNIYIRKFPYKKIDLSTGMWETTMSAKMAIS